MISEDGKRIAAQLGNAVRGVLYASWTENRNGMAECFASLRRCSRQEAMAQLRVGLAFQSQHVALGKHSRLRANSIVFDGNPKLDAVLVFQDNYKTPRRTS